MWWKQILLGRSKKNGVPSENCVNCLLFSLTSTFFRSARKHRSLGENTPKTEREIELTMSWTHKRTHRDRMGGRKVHLSNKPALGGRRRQWTSILLVNTTRFVCRTYSFKNNRTKKRWKKQAKGGFEPRVVVAAYKRCVRSPPGIPCDWPSEQDGGREGLHESEQEARCLGYNWKPKATGEARWEELSHCQGDQVKTLRNWTRAEGF